MTTYTAIANSEIAVGAPITNTLMTKLRDNPLAIAEGDATAPEIDGSAITAGTQSLLPTDFANYTAGSYQLNSIGADGNEGEVDASSYTLLSAPKLYCPTAGTANIYFEMAVHSGGGGSYTATARIYVNGVATGTVRTCISDTFACNFTESISFNAGDLIEIYGFHNNSLGGANRCRARNMRISIGNPLLPIAAS